MAIWIVSTWAAVSNADMKIHTIKLEINKKWYLTKSHVFGNEMT